MSHSPTHSDIATGASLRSACVSLVTLILSFFNTSHVWLQNVTLLISFAAGCFAIAAGIKKIFFK